ncbi:hypothetical protein AVEN_65671-1 [Araneus ventricosus]|uniref:Uncharacterized protein n=1 Tax=Araneus ventricosus TaxID=182803 RepID=A0A4Y2HJL0_ARAVE|nr:hypothetical protein AVEN_65671-1 [Araneus ventricosus]
MLEVVSENSSLPVVPFNWKILKQTHLSLVLAVVPKTIRGILTPLPTPSLCHTTAYNLKKKRKENGAAVEKVPEGLDDFSHP